ncbi:acyltransferase family protein [Clostridium sp. OS1-26]|uniref:acyltransferase family protein n=1 Tax=Clostridium sp. OS1-26 TaxID=3070681 RepID=UPI0027DF3865|nr:acyltransferase family protein [Clostridium sp. OS1-26]WML34487.1 acyltransferase family protein [Clostridium sp. OS1-26]
MVLDFMSKKVDEMHFMNKYESFLKLLAPLKRLLYINAYGYSKYFFIKMHYGEEISMLDNTQNHRYIAGLDGLRAFAVLAVIAYHFNFSWAGGGFLGVDIFFVISGYLITSNILALQESELNFSFREFWIRRIRRLLPAAYIMIIAVFVWTMIFKSEMVNTLKGDASSSIMYVSNWWFIFHKLSYFNSFGLPSPLKNLWSLAIEEQFYIVWPIVLITGLKVFKKRAKFSNIVFIAALCSAILLAILYKPGEDPSRVYYGTDTRAFELLIGSWLAIIYPMKRLSSKKSIKQRNMLNITSIIAFIIFIISVIFMNEYQAFLYRGGMLLLSLNAAILIACVCHPSSYLGHLLSWKPLSWLGKRSYGIYLWHYPIIVLSTPAYEIGNPTYWRVGLQLAATLIIAEISYRFIEMPIRQNGFRGVFKRNLLINAVNWRRLTFARGISIIIIPLVIVLLTACIRSVHKDKQQMDKAKASSTEIVINNEKQSSTSKNSGPSSNEKSEASSLSTGNSYNKVLAIGDSIMLDIVSSLNKKYTNITIDGKVGRQLSQAVELAPAYAAFNDTNNAVIIELGTNGYFTDRQIDSLLNFFSKAHIYLVNTRVPRQWEKEVNETLSKKAKESKNITLIDWHSTAITHPEYFTPDGVHLMPKGIEVLTSLIDQLLKSKN